MTTAEKINAELHQRRALQKVADQRRALAAAVASGIVQGYESIDAAWKELTIKQRAMFTGRDDFLSAVMPAIARAALTECLRWSED